MFEQLCGLLAAFGKLFGWDYEEVSVRVCIDWLPHICTLVTVPIIVGLIMRIVKNKKRLLGIYLLPAAITHFLGYSTVASTMYNHYHYQWVPAGWDDIIPEITDMHAIFMHCQHDLQEIAATCNTTYATVNMVIYVYFFAFIIILNSGLSIMAFPKRRNKNKTATPPQETAAAPGSAETTADSASFFAAARAQGFDVDREQQILDNGINKPQK